MLGAPVTCLVLFVPFGWWGWTVMDILSVDALEIWSLLTVV